KEESAMLPDVPPWPESQMLTYEKEVLGFYVTSNPISKHAEMIRMYSTTDTSRLGSLKEGKEVLIGGMVNKIRHIVTKNGKNAGAKMAVFEMEDVQGKCEVVLFPRTLERFGHAMEMDKIVFVRGTVDTRRETPNIICEELIGLDEIGTRYSARV